MLTNSTIGDIKYYFQNGNKVLKLIFANIGVFLFIKLVYLLCFFGQHLDYYSAFIIHCELPASLPLLLSRPYTLLTFMFLHVEFMHLLFNMLWLYWFGEIFILYVGDKRVLSLYLFGGLSGALFYILSFNLLPVFHPQLPYSLMLGASASILAIVFAAATLNPNHEIRIILIGNVKLKYVAIVPLILDIISIPDGNAGGYISHVGGALLGFIYIKALQNGWDLSRWLDKFFEWKHNLSFWRPKPKVIFKNTNYKSNSTSTSSKSDQEKVDAILDKIARAGYDSLTKEEKDFLFQYSNK